MLINLVYIDISAISIIRRRQIMTTGRWLKDFAFTLNKYSYIFNIFFVLHGLCKKQSYHSSNDWFTSFSLRSSIRNNKPIPWINYTAIDFLEPRISKEMKVFEFGSGNSTYFGGLNGLLQLFHVNIMKNGTKKMVNVRCLHNNRLMLWRWY